MKKLFALLSLVAFLAVSVNAQTPKAAPTETKKETAVAKTDDKAPAAKMSCCTKANAACCKNNKEAKNCTAEQKAACAKAGASKECSHGKAEASDSKETKAGMK